MNKTKIFAASLLALGLVACSTMDYSPAAFKNNTAKQILAGGKNALNKGNYSESVKYFEAIEALYPFDPEAQQAEKEIIYAYYKADDNASALAAADRYIHLYPEGDNADYAYYMKGIINSEKDRTWTQRVYPKNLESLDLSSLHEALVDFDTLLKLFPKSSYVPDAKNKMHGIRELLAKHELQIAKFYFERKAYVAAANRASYIVKQLNGSAQNKEALKIMVESYRALGADKQADEAERMYNSV